MLCFSNANKLTHKIRKKIKYKDNHLFLFSIYNTLTTVTTSLEVNVINLMEGKETIILLTFH